MLHIGQFSFDELGKNEEKRHGYFTCAVGSKDVDGAVQAFKLLIKGIKAESKLFARIKAVYIEDIFNIKDIPDKAVMLRIQSCDGEFPESVSRSLPLSDDEGINAYGWSPDVRKIRAAEKDKVVEMTPFLTFE